MTKKEANFRLKNLVDTFGQDFETSAEASRVAFMQSARGGDMIPVPGRFYSEEARDQFQERCLGYAAQAQQIIDTMTTTLRTVLAEAPSEEAVRVIQLLMLRKDLTEEEIYNLLEVYGDNAQAYKAIASVAAEKGLFVTPCPVDQRLKTYADLAASLEKTFTATSAEGGHASDGYLSMLKWMIDNVIPVEE